MGIRTDNFDCFYYIKQDNIPPVGIMNYFPYRDYIFVEKFTLAHYFATEEQSRNGDIHNTYFLHLYVAAQRHVKDMAGEFTGVLDMYWRGEDQRTLVYSFRIYRKLLA
jgi:hypothetical protein